MSATGEKVLLSLSRDADAAIAENRLFAFLNSDQEVVITGAGGVADGVSRWAVSAAGKQATLEVSDFLLVTAGGVIAKGAEVMSDAAGKAVTWVPGNAKLGRHEGTANSAAGEIIRIKFYRAGQEYDGHDVLSVDGAVTIPTRSKTFFMTKAGVLALTIADPTADTHDGVALTFVSTTAQAHTLSNAAGSGFFSTGGAGKDIATFSGAIGDGLTIIAFQGKWYIDPRGNTGITLG